MLAAEAVFLRLSRSGSPITEEAVAPKPALWWKWPIQKAPFIP